MRSELIVESQGTRTERQWLNAISGWVIGIGVAAVLIALDPLGVYSTWSDGGQGVSVDNLLIVAWFMFISMGSVAIFGRPRLEIGGAGMFLRNILRDVTIPWNSVEELDSESSSHLRIKASGRWYRVWGLEKTNAAQLAGHSGVAGKAAQSVTEARESSGVEASGSHPTIRWRQPERGETLLLLVWLTYVVVGLSKVAFG